MDEEQVKKLIQDSLAELQKELLSQVDAKNSGLAASLTRELKKQLSDKTETAQEPSSDEGKLTLKSLQTQLAEMQKQYQASQHQLRLKSVESMLAQKAAVAKMPPKLVNFFLATNELTFENDKAFVGETPLETAFDSWLKTEAVDLVPQPTGTKPVAGSPGIKVAGGSPLTFSVKGGKVST